MPILHSISSGCHVRPRPRCPAPVRRMATRVRLTATGWHTDRSIRLTVGFPNIFCEPVILVSGPVCPSVASRHSAE